MPAKRAPVRRSRTSDRITVRTLRWSDFEPLTAGYLHLYDERAAGRPHGIHLRAVPPTMAEEVDWFAGLYRQLLLGNAVAVVAERRGRPVGSCTVLRAGPAGSEGGHVGVLGILVHEGHRGAGVGSALLRAALRRSRSKFETVRLGVFGTNTGARRLYERFGFRAAGTIPRAFRRRGRYIDEELMVLAVRRPPQRRAKR